MIKKRKSQKPSSGLSSVFLFIPESSRTRKSTFLGNYYLGILLMPLLYGWEGDTWEEDIMSFVNTSLKGQRKSSKDRKQSFYFPC